MTDYLDYNDAPLAQDRGNQRETRLSVPEVKQRLMERLPDYIEYLMPNAVAIQITIV